MSMRKGEGMSQAVKVGLFMTACLVVLGYLILRVEDLQLFAPARQYVDVHFETVAGLDERAAVRVAGVRVGRVDRIQLEAQRARVTLLLDEPVVLTEGTTAAVLNMGILGDRYVELRLGPPDAPPLSEDAVLQGSVPVTFDQALEQMGAIGDSLRGVAESLTGERDDTDLARLIGNLEAASRELHLVLAESRASLAATAANMETLTAELVEDVPRLTRQIEAVMVQVEGMVEENREDLRGAMANVRAISERVQASVEHVNEISARVARGEGTVGKLFASEEAYDGLVGALGSVQQGVDTLTETFGRVQRMELRMGLEGSYFADLDDTRSAFTLNIDPQTDRFYLLEVVDDPRGRFRQKTDTVTVTHPDGTTETTIIERETVESKIRLSAQFGFKVGDWRLRAGIIESTGGGGLDLSLLDDRARLGLDAFEFSRPGDLRPRLRLTGRWGFHRNFYVFGGYDDLLERDLRSTFVGGGFQWSDEDLKYLLGSVPRF